MEAATVLAVSLLAAAVYVGGLDHPFVFDDAETVVGNPSLKDPGNWRFVLLYSLFRPWVNVSYAVDHAVWGLKPFGFHLTNVLLHALNAGLLAVLARRLWARGASSVPAWVAVLAPAVWAVHPLLTQAVGYVSQRAELLACTAMLGGLLCFERAVVRRSRGWLAAAAGVVLVGFGTKETAAMAPVVLWLFDVLLLRRETDGERTGLGRRRAFHAVLMGLLVVGVAVRLWVLARMETQPLARGFAAQALLQVEVFWRYVRLLVLPYGQSVVQPVREASDVGGALALGLLGLVAWGVVAWRLRRVTPEVAFGMAVFPLLLLPSGAVPLLEPMAEHRVYTASIGLAVAAVGALMRVDWCQKSHRQAVVGVSLVVGIGLAVLTVRRVEVWSSAVSLWSDAVAKAPDVWAARYGLAEALREEGNCAKAIPEYRAATRLISTETRAWLNLGICLGQEGALPEARASFEQVTRLDAREVKAWNNLATVSLLEGKKEEARRHVDRALELEPGNAQALRLRERVEAAGSQRHE